MQFTEEQTSPAPDGADGPVAAGVHMVLDTFSGLPDMDVLLRRLQRLADSQGPPCPVPLVLLVVDRVPDIASQYGVSAAQQLNGQLAARLLRVVHGDGNVFNAALGCFLVVLSGARDEARGRQDAEAIRAQLSGTYVVGTQFMRANVRFGVTMYDGSETDIELLLARATADLEGGLGW